MTKKITCPRCKGDGHIELPFELDQALRYVALAHPATANGLHKAFGKTRTSANHRLERLYRAGLVTRKLVSREYNYFVKE